VDDAELAQASEPALDGCRRQAHGLGDRAGGALGVVLVALEDPEVEVVEVVVIAHGKGSACGVCAEKPQTMRRRNSRGRLSSFA
jgi:hypothetical protein